MQNAREHYKAFEHKAIGKQLRFHQWCPEIKNEENQMLLVDNFDEYSQRTHST